MVFGLLGNLEGRPSFVTKPAQGSGGSGILVVDVTRESGGEQIA